MIDVHCLLYKEDNKYFPQLLKQLMTEKDIMFYPVYNGTNIGEGRVKGFLTGSSPYLSFVDYDDLIEPGIFTKINSVMETGVAWCYTNEMLIDEENRILQPGWSSNPELYSESILSYLRINKTIYPHHIVAFRRDLFTPRMLYIMKQLKELPEEYLHLELAQYEGTHINEVGYYWRQHEFNGMKQYECYKDGVRLGL